MIPVLFIMGMPRSGSTLLERLIGGFTNTTVIGEQQLVWKQGFLENTLCTCGNPVLCCPFYQRARRNAMELDPDLAGTADLALFARYMVHTLEMHYAHRLRGVPQMYLRGRMSNRSVNWPRFRHALLTWYSAVSQAGDGSVIVDSSKGPAYAHLLGTIPGLNVGYIHLVRDSRAVAFSRTRTKRRPEVLRSVETLPTETPWRTAINWDVNLALSSLLSTRRPNRVIQLEYEAMVRQPEAALAAVANLATRLGMPQLGALDFNGMPARYHSVAGNPIRFDRSPLRIEVDDEWRTRMKPTDRAVVTALTAPLLLRHHLLGARAGRPRGKTLRPSR